MHRGRADRNEKVKLGYKIVDKELRRAQSCGLYKVGTGR